MSARMRTAISLTSTSALGLFVLACDQPTPKCTVQRGAYAATYTLIGSVSGTGDCGSLKGEVLNVTAYGVPTSKSDPQPDPARTVIGMQPQFLTDILGNASATMVEPNPEDEGVSLGEFAKTEPAADDFCVAPTLSTARVRLQTIPEHTDMCVTTPDQPAVDVSYAFSNVRVYTTTSAYATQLAADLTYTKDGCTAHYRVAAVYPAVDCNGAAVQTASPATGDDAGAAPDAFVPQGMDASADIDAALPEEDAGELPTDEAACPPPETVPDPFPDETLCLPYADPSRGRENASGLNPDFAIRCDPDLLLCVLSKEPPSLR